MTLFATVAGCLWILALPLCFFAGGEALRSGLLLGWGFGGVSGVLTWAALVYSARSDRRAIPTAVIGGFAGRLALALIGLFVARRVGFDVLAFCVSFFALYWAFFVVEFVALRAAKVAPTQAVLP